MTDNAPIAAYAAGLAAEKRADIADRRARGGASTTMQCRGCGQRVYGVGLCPDCWDAIARAMQPVSGTARDLAHDYAGNPDAAWNKARPGKFEARAYIEDAFKAGYAAGRAAT